MSSSGSKRMHQQADSFSVTILVPRTADGTSNVWDIACLNSVRGGMHAGAPKVFLERSPNDVRRVRIERVGYNATSQDNTVAPLKHRMLSVIPYSRHHLHQKGIDEGNECLLQRVAQSRGKAIELCDKKSASKSSSMTC